MENQENWLVFLCSNSILNILLVLAEEFWVKLDVTRFVNTMNITETGSDRKIWRDGRESLVDCENVLGLGVEGVVVNVLVIDTILLATSDTNLLQSC
jgi:hypothetical protein